MSEVKTTLVTNAVENLPVLDEVPEGATLIAEVDGEFYRVKGDGLGGKKPDIIIEDNFNSSTEEATLGINVSFEELQARIKSAAMNKELLVALYYGVLDGEPMYTDMLTMFEVGTWTNENDDTTQKCIWLGGSNWFVYLEDGTFFFD